MKWAEIWPRIRTVWVTLGIAVTVGLAGWSLIAYRASSEGRAASVSDPTVEVIRTAGLIEFRPSEAAGEVALMFFPGALVDPVAYAPLARRAAAAGFPVYVVPMPKRGAFGGADDPGLYQRVDSILRSPSGDRRWVLGGHSRGGVVASTVTSRAPELVEGLILIGTSHPRDVDLSALRVPTAKVVGTRDGLASPPEVRANAHLLPRSTEWTWIEGGNHSQFGWYGFQPGDRFAHISRAEQQRATEKAVLDLLQRVGSAPTAEFPSPSP